MFMVSVFEDDGEHTDDDGKRLSVYDVVCHKRGNEQIRHYFVNLERIGYKDRRRRVIPLINIMRSYDGSWWTLTGDPKTSVQGFKTRRLAIEHELRRQGYWKDRNG